MKKAVFFDIDGTLWDNHMQIPKSTVTSIKRLRENGHYAFLCSGRSRAAIQAEELLLGIGFDGILAACGTHVEYQGKLIYERNLSEKELDELFSIFSYIRPRKFQADLTIGMDDPAAMGKILSYYGMLYPLIGSCVNVIPDFERKRMEGTVFIKGKIRLFNFIKAALRIYFNKDIRKLLKLFKKEDL